MPTAKEYFKSMFQDEIDYTMFLLNYHTCHVQNQKDAQQWNLMPLVSTGLGRWDVYDIAPVGAEVKVNSNPMAFDDHRLMPAIVEHYFCNSRHRLSTRLHYFWLHWFLDGSQIASTKVQANSDGEFPIVFYDLRHGNLTNTVTANEQKHVRHHQIASKKFLRLI